MDNFEAAWIIAQLLFWLGVTGAVAYFCFLVLGFILLSFKLLFSKLIDLIRQGVEQIFFAILDWVAAIGRFAIKLLGFCRNNKSCMNDGGERNERVFGSESMNSHTSVFDPYQILEVAPGVSSNQIKAAYIKQMAQYHPDKVSHLGKELQAFAEEKAKSIQEAYSMLQNN